MTFHWIYFVAAVMVMLGAVLAKYSVSDAERYYARYLMVAGVLFVILPAFWGCSSPTAPSQTVRLEWRAAPGCTPGAMPSPLPSGAPVITVQLPGSDRMTAGWPGGVTVEFRQFGQTYLVCRVVGA